MSQVSRFTSVALLIASSVGCSVQTMPGPAGGSGTDIESNGDPTPKDPTVTSNFDAAKVCAKIASSVEECASSATINSACPTLFKNAAARGCDKFLAELQSWVLADAQPYQCITIPDVGTTASISSAATEMAVVADACAGAVNKSECYSIACERSLDCPSGASCNDATKHCFSTAANCAGMPCERSLDCPSGQTCNDAHGVCIRN